MITIDVNALIQIAATTQVFTIPEIAVLREVLEKSTFLSEAQDPSQIPDYIIFEEKRQGATAGFVIFGKTPMTQSNWDVYWIVTRKDLQGTGVGRILMQRVEKYIQEKECFANIRLETSSRDEYLPTRTFYAKNGYKEAGRIPDFYSSGDDLVTFYKKLEPVII